MLHSRDGIRFTFKIHSAQGAGQTALLLILSSREKVSFTCLLPPPPSPPGSPRIFPYYIQLRRPEVGLATEFRSEKIPLFRGRKWSFRGLRTSQFRSLERNGMTWEKLVLQKILLQQTELTVCFCPRHASERNSELVSLPRNGLGRNSKSLLLFLFHGTEFLAFFSSEEWCGTEFREFSFPRNSRNSAGTNQLFRLFRLPRNNFLSEIVNTSPRLLVLSLLV